METIEFFDQLLKRSIVVFRPTEGHFKRIVRNMRGEILHKNKNCQWLGEFHLKFWLLRFGLPGQGQNDRQAAKDLDHRVVAIVGLKYRFLPFPPQRTLPLAIAIIFLYQHTYIFIRSVPVSVARLQKPSIFSDRHFS